MRKKLFIIGIFLILLGWILIISLIGILIGIPIGIIGSIMVFISIFFPENAHSSLPPS